MMNDNPQINAAELADVIAAELISVRDSMILNDQEKTRIRAADAMLSERIGNALFGPDSEARNNWLRSIGEAAPKEAI